MPLRRNLLISNTIRKIDILTALNLSCHKTLTPKAPIIIVNPSTVITIQPHFHLIIIITTRFYYITFVSFLFSKGHQKCFPPSIRYTNFDPFRFINVRLPSCRTKTISHHHQPPQTISTTWDFLDFHSTWQYPEGEFDCRWKGDRRVGGE